MPFKDKNLINKDEVGGYATKFKCKPLSIRVAKGIVGESTNNVEEYIQELRNQCSVMKNTGSKTVRLNFPIDLLFNAKDLEVYG